MTSIAGLLTPKRSTVGNVILDATLSETHRKSARLTDHPIEEGANVTDHIQQLPDELELTGTVSDFPVYWFASTLAKSPLSDDPELGRKLRGKKAYDELVRVKEAGELITVVTSLATYENMAITSLVVPRDAGLANESQMAISLRQLVTVTTQPASAPQPVAPSHKGPVKKGKVTTKDAATENPGTNATTDSLGASIVGFIRG